MTYDILSAKKALAEAAEANAGDKTADAVLSMIPAGPYCYSRDSDGKKVVCPFWAINKDAPKQMEGWCAFLGEGDDSEDGVTHLFDQVKACGVNDDEDGDFFGDNDREEQDDMLYQEDLGMTKGFFKGLLRLLKS